MTELATDVLSEEDLALCEEDDGYDPLDVPEAKDADETAETFGYVGTAQEGKAAGRGRTAPERPARERIEELFANMPPYRQWFRAILRACAEPQDAEGIDRVVEGLRGRQKCVYQTANFCDMLEEAGALRRLTVDGEPYDEVEPQLVEVEEDGRKYLRPTPAPKAVWQATPEALEVLAEHDPLDALLSIVEEQQAYVGVFEEILGMCDGDGSSVVDIRRQVNSNPALEYPKKTAQYFMDYLCREGAIEWDGAWKITDLGRRLLACLQAGRE